MSDAVISKLVETIRARRNAPGETSYTRQLLDAGVERCARKFGEEAVETVIAALGTEPSALVGEAADVIYHLLVLLEVRGVEWTEVCDALTKRMKISGVAEKAARVKPAP